LAGTLSRSLQRRLNFGSQQIEVQLFGIVRFERMKTKPFPPVPGIRVQRGDDDGAASRFLVELDGCEENVRCQGAPDAEVGVSAVDGQSPSRRAGTGSGAPLATS
jgi:hypothetical protein